jgi:hypothetical protein
MFETRYITSISAFIARIKIKMADMDKKQITLFGRMSEEEQVQ